MLRSVRSVALLTVTVALLVLPLTAAAKPPDGFATFTYTHGLQPRAFSEREVPAGGPATFNTDLAFWGNLVVQGTVEGFRIVDVTATAKPKELVDFRDCVAGTTTGGEGDVVVWDRLLVRAWSTPAPAGGAMCGSLATPEGQEGLHVFDISDPAHPVGVAFVPVTQGSHSVTAVPDPANGRLLLYSSSSSTARAGFEIVQVPLADPASASVVRFVPAGRACRTTGVILGSALVAACAGGNGYTAWSLDPAKGGALDNPKFLYSRVIPGITSGHATAFSWDGRVLVFGHEPGGGTQALCQASTPALDRSILFFEARTGVELGRWAMPRPQTADENCAIHNFNVVPTPQRGSLLIAGNYQSGTSVVDFSDPANAVEIAYADPAPLAPAQVGGDWATYWYDGFVYQSDMRRGLLIWKLRDSEAAGFRRLGHLNPQTQETTLKLKQPIGIRPTTGSFTLVGHEPLMNRGMNAALAIHGNYAYIGSRTDGDHENSNHAGVFIVDISSPANPRIVHEIGPPLEGNMGESSRELRVWSAQEILIVLHTNCGGAGAHGCDGPSMNNFRFYDISGAFATNPRLIAELPQNTHEFFLWQDPANPDRALMYGGNATGQGWQIWDLSPLLAGSPPTRIFNGNHGYTQPTGGLHSFSVSNDGRRAYFALLNGGFAVTDVSDFAAGLTAPQYRQITIPSTRPRWAGPGAHSAVKLWNRDWVYVSDEVYGTATGSGHGCPWGWARMIDIADPTRPVVRSEFRLPENYTFLCSLNEPKPRTSFSAHNPTLTPNVVFTSWHSSGMQAISVEDPTYPYQLAEYKPEPLDAVMMEDPRLSDDPADKVVMWSYPIVKDGLIYVVDLRNGLYVLRYDGPFEAEVNDVTFLEGNSNQGHALCFEPVGAAPAYC